MIVLTGAGRGFCSGQDLGDAKAWRRRLRAGPARRVRADAECDLRLPGADHRGGQRAGGGRGANLALAADVVIAAQSAVFLQAFARIGLIPDAGGTYWLPRQIGFARAMGAVLFAEPVTASRPRRGG